MIDCLKLARKALLSTRHLALFFLIIEHLGDVPESDLESVSESVLKIFSRYH